MILDERIASSTRLVAELPLCNVYLQNESRFPWLVLVPRQPNLVELIDLSAGDQPPVLTEIALISQVMKSLYQPDKLNVANLGNVVAQLHIHVVARFKIDAAWPDPIWGKFSAPIHYSNDEMNACIAAIQAEIAHRAL